MNDELLARLVDRVENRFYGKYRGLVADNADPERRGRLRLRVPSVLGDEVTTGWALPCAPYGGGADQGFLFVPETGAGVWVEFEAGELEYPVWVGTFWSQPGGETELPRPVRADGSTEAEPQNAPTSKIIKTPKGHTIQLEDKDGAETLVIADGAHKHRIVFDDRGVTITEGRGGNEIILAAGGIKVGGGGAAQAFVLGDTFKTLFSSLMTALLTHTHIGNMGAPTSPPIPPLPHVEVPLSLKHKVE